MTRRFAATGLISKSATTPQSQRLFIMVSTVVPEIRKRGDVTVIAFGVQFETLDENVLDKVRDVVMEAARSADPPIVLIDLSHTKFFGSSFIEILFRVWNRINTQPGGKFALSGLNPYCLEILQVTHLDKLWALHPNEDTAIANLS